MRIDLRVLKGHGKTVREQELAFADLAKSLAEGASNIGRWTIMLGAIKYANLHNQSIGLKVAAGILNLIFITYILTFFALKFELVWFDEDKPRRGWLWVVVNIALALGSYLAVRYLTDAVVDALASRA